MKTGIIKMVCSLCLVVFIGLPGVIHADMYLKYKQHTDGFSMMGHKQPAKDTITETWVAKDMVRSNQESDTMIMRYDKKMIYIIDDAKKIYHEAPMSMDKIADASIEDNGDMTEEEKASARQAMKGMMQGMGQFSVTVKETGEKKKIGRFNCRKYIQEMQTGMGPLTSEIWATRDIKLDYELLNKMSSANLMMMPGAGENVGKISKEMNKIKGISVYTLSKSNMMNTEVRSTRELIDYADKKTPAGFYEPPKGYKLQK